MYAVPFYTVFLIILLVYAIISFLVVPFYLSYFFIAYFTLPTMNLRCFCQEHRMKTCYHEMDVG